MNISNINIHTVVEGHGVAVDARQGGEVMNDFETMDSFETQAYGACMSHYLSQAGGAGMPPGD